jgi:hypothetical protein
MSRARFEPVARICRRWQRRYRRLGMGVMKRPTPPRRQLFANAAIAASRVGS